MLLRMWHPNPLISSTGTPNGGDSSPSLVMSDRAGRAGTDRPAVWLPRRGPLLGDLRSQAGRARAGPDVFGGLPGEVGSGVVPDPANRTQIEVDVVVFAPAEPGQPRKILALGEAKWDRTMDLRQVERLRRARDLL